MLGQPFFIIYVNDMIRASKDLEFVQFADDTNIFVSGKKPRELFNKVNNGLVDLAKWFRCNKLTLKFKKTEYHLGKKIARHVHACKSVKKQVNLKNYMDFIN